MSCNHALYFIGHVLPKEAAVHGCVVRLVSSCSGLDSPSSLDVSLYGMGLFLRGVGVRVAHLRWWGFSFFPSGTLAFSLSGLGRD